MKRCCGRDHSGPVEVLCQDLGEAADCFISMFAFDGKAFVVKTSKGVDVQNRRMANDICALREAGIIELECEGWRIIEHPDREFIEGDYS